MAGRVVSKRKRVVKGLLLVGNVAKLIGRIAHRERKGNELSGGGEEAVEGERVQRARREKTIFNSRLGLDVNPRITVPSSLSPRDRYRESSASQCHDCRAC